jgi:hypothetical protein
MVLNLIPSLITLDGHLLPQRRKLSVGASKNGYVELFDATKYSSHPETAYGSQSDQPLSAVSEMDLKSTRLTQGLHTTIQSEASQYHHYYDGSDVAPIMYDGDSMAAKPSSLPWRNPPNPMPRQLLGKPLVGSIPAPNSNTVSINVSNVQNSSHHGTWNMSLNQTFKASVTSAGGRSASTGKLRPSSASSASSPVANSHSYGQSSSHHNYPSHSSPPIRSKSPSSMAGGSPLAVSPSQSSYHGLVNGTRTRSASASRAAASQINSSPRHLSHEPDHNSLHGYNRHQPDGTPADATSVTKSMRDALRRSSIRSHGYHTHDQHSVRGHHSQHPSDTSFYSLAGGRDPKEPARWLTPQLSRISRADKEARKQERAIVDMIGRIGLPHELNKDSRFWANRIEKGQTNGPTKGTIPLSQQQLKENSALINSGRTVQFSDDSIPPPPPPLPHQISEDVRRQQYFQQQYEHQQQQLQQQLQDDALMTEVNDRILRLKAETEYRMHVLRSSSASASSSFSIEHSPPSHKIPQQYAHYPPPYYQGYNNNQAGQANTQPIPLNQSGQFGMADDASTIVSEVTQPLYQDTSSFSFARTGQSMANSPPPPPPPSMLDPTSVSSGLQSMSKSGSYYQVIQQPGRFSASQTQDMPALIKERAAQLTISAEREPGIIPAPNSLSGLFNPVLENSSKLPQADAMDAPMIIEGYHVASAIDELMARKQRSLQLLEAASAHRNPQY